MTFTQNVNVYTGTVDAYSASGNAMKVTVTTGSPLTAAGTETPTLKFLVDVSYDTSETDAAAIAAELAAARALIADDEYEITLSDNQANMEVQTITIAKADMSLNANGTKTFTILGDGTDATQISNGYVMAMDIQVLGTSTSIELSSANDDSSADVLVNGGPKAPITPTITIQPYDNGANLDGSMNLTLGEAPAGFGIDISAIAVKYRTITPGNSNSAYVTETVSITTANKADTSFFIATLATVQTKSYELSVRFIDKFGREGKATVVPGPVFPTNNPGLVRDISLNGLTQDGLSMELKWNAPNYVPTSVSSYKIYWSNSVDDISGTDGNNMYMAHAIAAGRTQIVTDPSLRAATIPGLVNGEKYNVWMVAHSPTGAGLHTERQADSAGVLVAGAPGRPLDVELLGGIDMSINEHGTTVDTDLMNNKLLAKYQDQLMAANGTPVHDIYYALIRADDAGAIADLVDGSFSSLGMYSGSNTADASYGDYNVDISLIESNTTAIRYVDATTGATKWHTRSQSRPTGVTDPSFNIALGETYYIYMYAKNDAGNSARSTFQSAISSTLPDTQEGWKEHTAAWTDASLVSEEVALGSSALGADSTQMVASNGSVALKFRESSLVAFTGGSAITDYTLTVAEASGRSQDNASIRMYGSTESAQTDICNTALVVKNVALPAGGAFIVNEYMDASGAIKSFKNGMLFDVTVTANNANGASASVVSYQLPAPLGALGAVSNVRIGAAGFQPSGTDTITVSFEDVSGHAFTGGHLTVGVDVSFYQNTGPNGTEEHVAGTVNPVGSWVAGGANSITFAPQANAAIGQTGFAFGFPITCKIRAKTGVVANYTTEVVYGTQVTKVIGTPVVTHDEVQGLRAVVKDGAIDLQWQAPHAQLNMGPHQSTGEYPTIVKYIVDLYDISMTDGKSIGSPDNKLIAHGEGIHSASFTGLTNGHAYVPHVRVQFSQGVQGAVDSKTFGASINKTDCNELGSAVDGRYDISGVVGSVNMIQATPGSGSILVPAFAPIITANLITNSLKIDNNGSPLTFGAMIQVLPQSSSSGNNVFYLDLSASDNSITTAANNVQGNNFRKTHDVSGTLLGASWSGETNYIFSANGVGTTVETTNVL